MNILFSDNMLLKKNVMNNTNSENNVANFPIIDFKNHTYECRLKN